MELKNYKELFEEYDTPIPEMGEGMPTPKYVYMLNITVKNEGNADGYLSAMGFALYHGALQIPIDFEIWNMIDESIDGNIILKLREDSEATLSIPFTAQPLDEATNMKKLHQIIETESFDFCVSDFPVRKMIKVTA